MGDIATTSTTCSPAATPSAARAPLQGAHWIRLRRGKAAYVHAHLGAERLTALADRLVAAGHTEAGEPPITGA